MKDEGFVPGAWPETFILHPALHLKPPRCHSDQREESPTRIAQLVRTRNGSEGGRSRTERPFGGTSHPRVTCGGRARWASPGGGFLPLVRMTRDLGGECQPHIPPRDFTCKGPSSF